MTTPYPGRTIQAGLDIVVDVASDSGSLARIGVRRARAGELVDAYPAGTHDLELVIEGDPTSEALALVAESALASDSRCRRVVVPVPEQDLDSIAWAEDAGFRYVVDVETRRGGFSLLVSEPEWVLAQPHILEDIPLKE